MNMKSFLSVGLLMIGCINSASAQKHRKEKEKIPVYNYAVDDPMDAFGSQPAVVNTVISPLVFPDFYTRMAVKKNDTTFKFECYDAKDELLNVDTLRDFNVVKYISLFKSFDDPVHTYIDAGKEKPLPVSKIVYRYDKTGNDKWLSVDYASNKYITLKEDRNTIVHSDTVTTTDSISAQTKTTVYRYYKVVPVK